MAKMTDWMQVETKRLDRSWCRLWMEESARKEGEQAVENLWDIGGRNPHVSGPLGACFIVSSDFPYQNTNSEIKIIKNFKTETREQSSNAGPSECRGPV